MDVMFEIERLKLIQKEIVNLLSKKIIAGDIDKAKKVIVDSFEDAIIIRN